MKTIVKSGTILLFVLISINDCLAARYHGVGKILKNAGYSHQIGDVNTITTQPEPFLRLKMIKDSVNNDEIVIKCSNSASTKFVINEDAKDIGGIDAEESLSAFSSDNIPLAIDALPFPGLQQEEVPLLTDATTSGVYKLVSTQVYYLPSLYEMWLKDAFTGDSLRLVTNASYSFNIDKTNPATFGTTRFKVIIRLNPEFAYQLQSFTATKESGGHVQLAWKVVNEQNNTNYTVERSIDTGKTFIEVGELPGTGAGNYSLADNNPVNGQNYYHLKLVDSSLTVSYSKLVTLLNSTDSLTANSSLRVYPNPVSSMVNIHILEKTLQLGSYNITVTNSAGAIVTKATSPQSTWQAGVGNLLPGIYLIRVINNKDNTLVGETKFVKL